MERTEENEGQNSKKEWNRTERTEENEGQNSKKEWKSSPNHFNLRAEGIYKGGRVPAQ
jgi:hypothetical protein